MVECCINVESKENGDFSNGASNTMANLKQVFCFLKKYDGACAITFNESIVSDAFNYEPNSN